MYFNFYVSLLWFVFPDGPSIFCMKVKFVFEAFKKLRPGIPLKCLHGKMNQERRLGTYSHFSEKRSVLFSTDVSSRGLDFEKSVDWVVQVSFGFM